MRIPKDARAVVTGAGSGFGRAVSLELARRGARVIASDMNLDSAKETVEQIERAGGKAHAMHADVREATEVKALVDHSVSNWGGLDIIVNNAGVAVAGRVGEVPLEDWKFEIDINLMGVVHGCHFAVPVMRRAGRGWVLNVASAAGLLSAPMMGPYNATKAAVIALSETMRAELNDDHVDVSVLCPTFFRTNIHSAQRSPPELRAQSEKLVTRAKWSADEIARIAIDGLERQTLYILPQTDAKLLWRAKRAMGGSFYSLVGRFAGRAMGKAGAKR
jgi:NAD(P)-dependent dehydrogenase (short-subunit alcohol dehydrogenase family)